MKKALVFLAVLIALSTVSVMARDIEVKQFVPTLDGVISDGEYPDDSWFILDKATVTAYNGIWTGEMTDDLMAKYNFAWAADGIYVAMVAVDNTPEPATTWDVHSQDGGPAADGFQFNTGATWTTIGAFADGTLAPRTHFGGGEEVDKTSDFVKGKAVREGNVFTAEAFIPWNKFIDYDVTKGSKIPLLFTYMDRAAAADNVCYKSIDVGNWDGTTGDLALVLADKTYAAPAPATEAPAGDTPAAPQTGDAGIVLAIALLLASGVTLVSFRSRRSK